MVLFTNVKLKGAMVSFHCGRDTVQNPSEGSLRDELSTAVGWPEATSVRDFLKWLILGARPTVNAGDTISCLQHQLAPAY